MEMKRDFRNVQRNDNGNREEVLVTEKRRSPAIGGLLIQKVLTRTLRVGGVEG